MFTRIAAILIAAAFGLALALTDSATAGQFSLNGITSHDGGKGADLVGYRRYRDYDDDDEDEDEDDLYYEAPRRYVPETLPLLPQAPVLRQPLPPAAHYGPPPYEWLPPPRPSSCGVFRYWNGDRCADARFYPPYIGPRW